MRQKLFVVLFALAALAASPIAALADDEVSYDGRLEGYGRPVTLDGGGTAGTWFIFVGLGVLAVGILFMNARRSHLD